MPVMVADCDGFALQRLRDQKVRGAAIVGEHHGELEADISISDLRHAFTKRFVTEPSAAVAQ